MKKVLVKLFTIIIVLIVITCGVLLIIKGVDTYNTKKVSNASPQDTKKEEIVTLESLEAELVTAKQNIENKKNELQAQLDEKEVECDKLQAAETDAFFANSNGDEYYEMKRKHSKCTNESWEIKDKISDLKQGVAFFADDDEIKKLIIAKDDAKTAIDKFKNSTSAPFNTHRVEYNPNKTKGVLEIIGGVLIILIQVSSIVKVYNKIVKSLHRVENAFANIDVYLKKRWDMLPNIVESVKGYSTHESETLNKITKLRSVNYDNMNLNEKVALNNEINSAVYKVMILREDYPDLKANSNFLQLSSKLSQLEEDIADSRINYNDAVMDYNNIVKIFPNNIFATFFKYDEIEMFKISSEEKENIKVEF